MDAYILTEEERQSWHRTLRDRLGESYDYDLTNKKLDECAAGWGHAPKTFEGRIERKFFHKPPERKNVEPVDASIDELEDPIFKHLKASEIALWKRRFNEYMEDFSFNTSSDVSLLRQLVFEEIIQARSMVLRLDPKGQDPQSIEDQLNNSVRRLTELQKNLGINRDKRKDILDKEKGDVASLAQSLDEKIKIAEAEQRRWKQEEEFYLQKKSERPVINVLPPLESLSQDDLISLVDVNVEVPEKEEEKEEPSGLNVSGVKL